jgi:S-adenosylmethionine uptake transporter
VGAANVQVRSIERLMSEKACKSAVAAVGWLEGVSPVLVAACSIGVLTVMDATIKEATSRYPSLQVAFLRFLFGSLFALALAVAFKAGWPSFETVKANALRAMLVATTAALFFYALSVLPLADAIGVSFAAPFFVVLMGALILGEKLDGRIWLALALGFVGMLVILGGQIGRSTYSSTAWLGALAAVGSALTYALSMVLLRARARKDAILIIVLLHSIGPALILAVPASLVWIWQSSADIVLFAVMGALGCAGHIGLATAFSRAEAARLAPVEYTALVWGMLLGLAFFGELPGLMTVLGTGLIVAGTWLNSRRG